MDFEVDITGSFNWGDLQTFAQIIIKTKTAFKEIQRRF